MKMNNFDKQLEKTLKIGSKYTEEREKLKHLFCEEYDPIAIDTTFKLLKGKGHPSEKTFAEKFKNHYESDNYDEQEILEFKRLFEKYKSEIINDLEDDESNAFLPV